MSEVCSVDRDQDGSVEIHVEAENVAAAQRLLIDATYAVNSLREIDELKPIVTPAPDASSAAPCDGECFGTLELPSGLTVHLFA